MSGFTRPSQWYYFSVDDKHTSGTFSLAVSNTIDYDLREKAIQLPSTQSWASTNAEYSNVDATADKISGSCGDANRNVWFKFQARTNEIEVKVLNGGAKGNIYYPLLNLYDNSGNVLACHSASFGTSYLQKIDLIVGQWYYFSVDDKNTGGTFSLEVTDTIGFDLKEKAFQLSDIKAFNSSDASYSNIGATADKVGGSCGDVTRNVWFKFQSMTDRVEIKVMCGGIKGTMYMPILTLYDNSGNVIACHSSSLGTSFVQYANLTPGQLYYFSVDDKNTAGTFTLGVRDNLSFDSKSAPQIISHTSLWCSSDGEFSNGDASPDGTNNSTCSSIFTRNVWFKFQSTSTKATIKLLTGADKGTLTNGSLYLIDNDGNVISCKSSVSTTGTQIDVSSLVKGSWYYIAIDNHTGTSGTFSICLEGGIEASNVCENIYCDAGGGVGIGTPVIPGGYRLAVKGKIISEGVKVEAQSKWPDYVFENDYQLKKLSEVKEYIKANGHLPEIPAATEVENEGIDLGEMNSLLLRKLEEMTLYMIRLEERVNELESKKKK